MIGEVVAVIGKGERGVAALLDLAGPPILVDVQHAAHEEAPRLVMFTVEPSV